MKRFSGPKGRRANLFQRAVESARRRQSSVPPPEQRAPRSDNEVKEMQARLEAAFDGADAA
jgi:hypothetical protein